MEVNNFEDYFEKRYKGQLKYYGSASAKNKKKYNRFQWALIILSTVTTVFAALPPSINTFLGPFEPHYVVIITAALVAILTSALYTFQYQELWANYRSTKELLNPEIYKYLFNIGDYQGKSEEEKKATFVMNVETILGNEHTNWSAIKKANASSNQSQHDEIQNKLKERIKPPTTVSREEAANPEQTEQTKEPEQPEEITDIGQPGEPVAKTDDAGKDSTNETGK